MELIDINGRAITLELNMDTARLLAIACWCAHYDYSGSQVPDELLDRGLTGAHETRNERALFFQAAAGLFEAAGLAHETIGDYSIGNPQSEETHHLDGYRDGTLGLTTAQREAVRRKRIGMAEREEELAEEVRAAFDRENEEARQAETRMKREHRVAEAQEAQEDRPLNADERDIIRRSRRLSPDALAWLQRVIAAAEQQGVVRPAGEAETEGEKGEEAYAS